VSQSGGQWETDALEGGSCDWSSDRSGDGSGDGSCGMSHDQKKREVGRK